MSVNLSGMNYQIWSFCLPVQECNGACKETNKHWKGRPDIFFKIIFSVFVVSWLRDKKE